MTKKIQAPSTLSSKTSVVWGIEQIAQYLDRSESIVFGLVKKPGFPEPIIGQLRYRRWLAVEVIDYLINNRQHSNTSSKSFINSDLVTR